MSHQLTWTTNEAATLVVDGNDLEIARFPTVGSELWRYLGVEPDRDSVAAYMNRLLRPLGAARTDADPAVPPPFCITCDHHRIADGGAKHHCELAEKEAEAMGRLSLVTGTVRSQPCELVRADAERCGPFGAWYRCGGEQT